MVCCHASSAAWASFGTYSFAVAFVLVIKSVKVGGEGCFNDCGQACFQEVLRQKTSCDPVLDHCLDARFGCYECSQVRRSRDVSRCFVPDSRLACAECGLRHAVFCARELPFEGPLSNLVVDFCSSLFLKDCAAVYSQDVVDAADSQTLTEEGKFRLRVLAEVDAFVHCSNDVCVGQRLVRDVLSRSDNDSECDASSDNCGDFGHVLHVADPPLRRR